MPTPIAQNHAPSKRLDGILRSISRLRPLPGSATRVLKAIDDPHVSVPILAEMIALDQALTAFILRVANSAAMGYAIDCASVSEAIMRLGFKQVRSLVLSTIASGPLSARLSGYRIGNKGLWHHSLSVASAAHWLAGVVRYPDPEKAYVAGLLHDIGKLTLDQYVQADYDHIVEIMRSQRIPLWEVEEQLFGVDHAQVGGMVTSHWQFPPELIEAIRYHHHPTLQHGRQRLAAIVNLANAMIPQEHTSELSKLEGRIIHPEALEILNIEASQLETLQANLNSSLGDYQYRYPTP